MKYLEDTFNIKDFNMTTTRQTLRRLAATTWYIGAAVLSIKATSLLLEAYALSPDSQWVTGTVLSGIAIGLLKARFLFWKSCQRNLLRINHLTVPKIWQFFRPPFFLMLITMISLGATLSAMAHGNYPFLLSVALLDISIATALFASSAVFWLD